MQLSIVAPDHQQDDAEVVAGIVEDFFDAFTSGADLTEQMRRLRGWFHEDVRIVRTCGAEPVLYDADGFVEPREALLSGEDVTGFREWALVAEIRVFGDVAHCFCSYEKEGRQGDDDLGGRGMKSLQLLRTAAGWRILSAMWDDERRGLEVPPDWR